MESRISSTFTTLNYPGAAENSTNFSAINDSGLIAGHYGTDTPQGTNYTAFSYNGQSFSTFSIPGEWGTFARGINTDGVIVGEFGRDSGSAAFIARPAPVPVPAAVWLFGSALAGLVGFGHRKSHTRWVSGA